MYFVTFFYLVFLGCSAGGIALSTLVPATVSSISLLAKSSIASLQIWSLHGLLLTVEAAGLSYVSHVQVIFSLGKIYTRGDNIIVPFSFADIDFFFNICYCPSGA